MLTWGLPSAGNGRPAFRKVLRHNRQRKPFEHRTFNTYSYSIHKLSVEDCLALIQSRIPFFFYNPRMRCNHNDLTCQEYVQRITYLSQSVRWLSCRKALRHGLRPVPPHPAVRAARDARHRLLSAIGQDRAFRLLLSARDRGRGLKLQDDGPESIYYANPPRLELGGTGVVSTAQDYLPFCRMMLNGGTLDGVQILSPKTVAPFSLNYLPDGRELADMTLPGLFSGSTYAGVGFSLGGAVTVDIAKTRLPGSLGQYFWGGSAFWIDPKEELAVVFMTQVIGSEARLTLRRDLRTLVYSAMTESFA